MDILPADAGAVLVWDDIEASDEPADLVTVPLPRLGAAQKPITFHAPSLRSLTAEQERDLFATIKAHPFDGCCCWRDPPRRAPAALRAEAELLRHFYNWANAVVSKKYFDRHGAPIDSNTATAVQAANKRWRVHFLEEQRAVAILALVIAMREFKPELGFRFTTFASGYIRKHVGASIKDYYKQGRTGETREEEILWRKSGRITQPWEIVAALNKEGRQRRGENAIWKSFAEARLALLLRVLAWTKHNTYDQREERDGDQPGTFFVAQADAAGAIREDDLPEIDDAKWDQIVRQRICGDTEGEFKGVPLKRITREQYQNDWYAPATRVAPQRNQIVVSLPPAKLYSGRSKAYLDQAAIYRLQERRIELEGVRGTGGNVNYERDIAAQHRKLLRQYDHELDPAQRAKLLIRKRLVTFDSELDHQWSSAELIKAFWKKQRPNSKFRPRLEIQIQNARAKVLRGAEARIRAWRSTDVRTRRKQLDLSGVRWSRKLYGQAAE